MDVRLDDGGVHPQAPTSDDALSPPELHQPRQHVLEHGAVEEMRQPNQRLRIRHPLSVDAAERSVDQAAPHLTLALVETPVVEVLEYEHAQHHRGRRAVPATTLTLGVTPGQRVGDPVRQHVVVQERIDAPQRRIPQLVAVGQEHFDEAALPVRPPHHGVSGKATRPQSHRVSRVAARAARRRSRRSLTIARRRRPRQRKPLIRAPSRTGPSRKHRAPSITSAPESN